MGGTDLNDATRNRELSGTNVAGWCEEMLQLKHVWENADRQCEIHGPRSKVANLHTR